MKRRVTPIEIQGDLLVTPAAGIAWSSAAHFHFVLLSCWISLTLFVRFDGSSLWQWAFANGSVSLVKRLF